MRENPASEKAVAHLLLDNNLTVAVAESCTGGLVGYRMTSVPGSSDYFVGGVIAYCNEIKMKELDVAQDVLSSVGAVSREVAEKMAAVVRTRFGASIGVSVTGIAGPDGGTVDKPVGSVYIGLAHDREVMAHGFHFHGNREAIRHASSQAVFDMLRDYLKLL